MKIGDYVRTKNGKIIKVGEEELYDINLDSIKSSPNIIDLIEVGDYVNGRKVFQVGYNFQDEFVLKMSNNNYEDFIYEKDIKSILTYQQFDAMKYEVK